MDQLQSLLEGEWLTEGQTLPQILVKTAAVLEQGWTSQAQARNAYGERVHPSDETAVMFSIEGAVARASNDIGFVPPPVLRILDQEVLNYLGLTRLIYDEDNNVTDTREPAVAGIMEERDVAWFNDNYTYEEILKFFDYVISRSQ